MGINACEFFLMFEDLSGAPVTTARVGRVFDLAARGAFLIDRECTGTRCFARLGFVKVDLVIGDDGLGEADRLFAELAERVINIANWVQSIEIAEWEALRADRLDVKLLVVPQIDQDQFELDLPVELCRSLAHAGARLSIISND